MANPKTNGNAVSPGINYIRLINWVWQTVPSIAGCKASHLVLFLAIIDSINRNKWATVSLPFDYLLNKCHFNKRVYLKARQWLIDNELLEVRIGNGYQMATFGLGIAAQKCTDVDTGIGTSINGIAAQKCTDVDTYLETENNKNEKQVAAPLAPPPKKLVKKVKEEEPVEPHWNLLVGIWFSFNKERLGEEPSFERDDPKVLKRIIQRLKKRAEKKNVPWTETTAPQRLKSFLEGAYAEDWISKHFLLANLEKQFDIVIQKMAKKTNPGQVPATSKGSSESNRVELQYLYERFCEDSLDEQLINPEYYDRLVTYNLIPVGQLGKNGSASLPIDEQKKKGVLKYFTSKRETGNKLIV
jgi:hypothetical protein